MDYGLKLKWLRVFCYLKLKSSVQTKILLKFWDLRPKYDKCSFVGSGKKFSFCPKILTVALQNYMILIFRGKLTSRWFGKTGIVLKSTWDLNVTQIANVVPLRARVRPEFRTNFGV